MRKLVMLAVLTVSIVAFGYVFMGLEVRTAPPKFEEGPMGYEIFARADVWIAYFMLPFAHYGEEGFEFKAMDMETVKRLMGVGVAFRSEIMSGLFMRASADLPFMEWLDVVETQKPFKSNLGIQMFMGALAVEGGVQIESILDLQLKELRFKFGEVNYYIAVGVSF